MEQLSTQIKFEPTIQPVDQGNSKIIVQEPRLKIKTPLIIGGIFFTLVLLLVTGTTLLQKYNKKVNENNVQPVPNLVAEDKDTELAKKPSLAVYKGEDKIVGISKYDKNVTRMGDWLIFTPEDLGDYSVYARNIYTDETITVLDNNAVRDRLYNHKVASRESNKNLSKESLTSGYEKDLTKFKEDVIFKLNAYMNIGCLFKISLSNKIFKVSFYADKNNNNPNLVDLDGVIFLTIAFGDGCNSSVTIKKFDYEKFIPVGSSFEFGTSVISTTLIGYFKKGDAYVFSEYRTDSSSESESPCGTQVLLNLKGKKMNGGVTEYIQDNSLPNKIMSFIIDTESQRVYMINDLSLYYYDLENKKLVDVGRHNITSAEKNGGIWFSKVLSDGGLCVGDMLIDHTTGKMLSVNSDKCLIHYQDTPQDIFESLDLPFEFTLK